MPTLLQQVQVLRGIMDGERAFCGPAYVTVGLSRRCNLHCLGCPYHSASSSSSLPAFGPIADMPMDLARRLAEELPRLGTHLVIITGTGEPLMNPACFDIMALFAQAGLRVQLSTNGTLVDRQAAGELISCGVSSIAVSTWAINEEAHARLYAGTDPTLVWRRLEGLSHIAEAKLARGSPRPRLVLKSTLNHHNLPLTAEMIRVAHKTGCDAISFGPYRNVGDEFFEAALTPRDLEQVDSLLVEAGHLAESLGVAHNFHRLRQRYVAGEGAAPSQPCYVGWYHSRIRCDGVVLPCNQCASVLGDMEHSSLAEIWNGLSYRNFRRTAISPQARGEIGPACDCRWCCLHRDNVRIQKRMRWLWPFRP